MALQMESVPSLQVVSWCKFYTGCTKLQSNYTQQVHSLPITITGEQIDQVCKSENVEKFMTPWSYPINSFKNGLRLQMWYSDVTIFVLYTRLNRFSFFFRNSLLQWKGRTLVRQVFILTNFHPKVKDYIKEPNKSAVCNSEPHYCQGHSLEVSVLSS